MTSGLKTIIFPVKNLATAKAVFSVLLGTEPSVDEPYYVGFDAEGQHIGLDPNGHQQGMTGPVPYWHVSDIQQTVANLVQAGAQVRQEPKSVGGGRLIASVADADGNMIGMIQDA